MNKINTYRVFLGFPSQCICHSTLVFLLKLIILLLNMSESRQCDVKINNSSSHLSIIHAWLPPLQNWLWELQQTGSNWKHCRHILNLVEKVVMNFKNIKSLWQKEKMLITTMFSFHHKVFKRLLSKDCLKSGLFGKGFNTQFIMGSLGLSRSKLHPVLDWR